jgi:hypothetical protein
LFWVRVRVRVRVRGLIFGYAVFLKLSHMEKPQSPTWKQIHKCDVSSDRTMKNK